MPVESLLNKQENVGVQARKDSDLAKGWFITLVLRLAFIGAWWKLRCFRLLPPADTLSCALPQSELVSCRLCSTHYVIVQNFADVFMWNSAFFFCMPFCLPLFIYLPCLLSQQTELDLLTTSGPVQRVNVPRRSCLLSMSAVNKKNTTLSSFSDSSSNITSLSSNVWQYILEWKNDLCLSCYHCWCFYA